MFGGVCPAVKVSDLSLTSTAIKHSVVYLNGVILSGTVSVTLTFVRT